MIKGVLLDLAGVIYDGEDAVPGATEAVARLHEAGLLVCFVSNTTRSNKQAVLDRLARLCFSVTSDELFTPAQAARNWLRKHERSPHLLLHPDLIQEFQGLEGSRGKAIVVGDAGDAFDYEALNAAFRELVDGAELLALAANRTFRVPTENSALTRERSSLHWNSQAKETPLSLGSRLRHSSARHSPPSTAQKERP
ncbi:hypothetical protein [Ensifer sp. Root1252]|uniref:hypothetical protein n=1 Tax=unclassified Ensifer TaxID=2633371 RepID=UPI003241D751